METILRLVGDIIGDTQSDVLSREVLTWGETDKIIYYLQDNKSTLESIIGRKQFVSEYAKIRYFSTVVKNGLRTYIMPSPDVIKQTDNEFYESKYKPKKRRKCLSEIVEGSEIG